MQLSARCLLVLSLTVPVAASDARGFDHMLALSTQGLPEREQARAAYRFRRALSFTDVFGLRYMHYSPGDRRQVVGFQLQNAGSPRVNPTGLRRSGTTREFLFAFPDRARQEIHLMITDDTRVSGRYSEDNMFREIAFFPRRYLPTLRQVGTGKGARLEVRLPTGEHAQFDPGSLELTDGVLSEQPIDRNRNRHQRHHPRVRYHGEYIAVTSDQRGESTRRERVWGQTRYADIHYPSRYPRACRVRRAEIWDQRPTPGDADRDPRLTTRHASDDQFMTFVERRCGWDLSAIRKVLREPVPVLRVAVAKPAAKPRVVVQEKDRGGLFGWFNRSFGKGSPPTVD